ncbi:MAG: tripartite tricarboxylate transporter TctB family protein [Planctomycetes bacterium]|nr:tripartite tricarboxylate transporter TctB family protein [Planctomycetota bacterium]
MRWRRHAIPLALIAVLAALCWSSGTDGDSAGSYPARTIKMVVPFNPGGGSDSFGRMIEAGIEKADLLPQPLIVVNRPGASATIGSRYVKDARPDGYTVLLLHNAIITAQYSGMVNYGVEDFEPIAATGEIPMVIAVHESSRFETLQQLLDEAKEKPDTIVHGVNLGAPTHFAALKLENASGGKFRFTQAGDGADRFGKLKEHIDVAGFSVAEFASFRSEGLRGLALLDVERNPTFDDVPTAIEQGYDVTELNSFYWWFPKGTPKDRADYFAGVLEKAMKTEFVQGKLAELNMAPSFVRGQEFQELIADRVRTAAAVGEQKSPEVPNIPLFVGLALAACLAVVVTTQLRSASKDVSRADNVEATMPRSTDFNRPGLLLLAAAFYVAAMQLEWLGYAVATPVFIIAAGLVLSKEPRRILLPLCEVALIVGLGTFYVLTNVVVTDLP